MQQRAARGVASPLTFVIVRKYYGADGGAYEEERRLSLLERYRAAFRHHMVEGDSARGCINGTLLRAAALLCIARSMRHGERALFSFRYVWRLSRGDNAAGAHNTAHICLCVCARAPLAPYRRAATSLCIGVPERSSRPSHIVHNAMTVKKPQRT